MTLGSSMAVRIRIRPWHRGQMLMSMLKISRYLSEIGCPKATTRNNGSPLDFIEFFQKRSTQLIDIVGPLYRNGLSISDIEAQTGLKRHSIWKALRAHKKELRPQDPVPFERWRQGRGKMKARPPFGYCYFQGVVIKDPKEYPTLQLIQSLWQQGMSISSIVRKLDEKGIKTRMKKQWSYNVIKSIIARLQGGSMDHLASSSKPAKSKSKSTEVKHESR